MVRRPSALLVNLAEEDRHPFASPTRTEIQSPSAWSTSSSPVHNGQQGSYLGSRTSSHEGSSPKKGSTMELSRLGSLPRGPAGKVGPHNSAPKPQTHLQKKWAVVTSVETPGTPQPVRQVRREFSRALKKVQLGVAASQAQSALQKEIVFVEEEMRHCFEAMDDDNNGTLDLDELGAVYREAGVDCTKDDLRRLLKRARHLERAAARKGQKAGSTAGASSHGKSDSAKGKKSVAQQEEADQITFADFKNMMQARPDDDNEEEDAAEAGGFKSAADLPLSLSLVASGHRRKTILSSYLANEFNIPTTELDKRVQNLRAVTQRHGLAAFVEYPVGDWAEPEPEPSVEAVRDRAYKMLPPRMRQQRPSHLYRWQMEEPLHTEEGTHSRYHGARPPFPGADLEGNSDLNSSSGHRDQRTTLSQGHTDVTYGLPLLTTQRVEHSCGRHLGSNISCPSPMLPVVGGARHPRRTKRPAGAQLLSKSVPHSMSLALPQLYPSDIVNSVLQKPGSVLPTRRSQPSSPSVPGSRSPPPSHGGAIAVEATGSMPRLFVGDSSLVEPRHPGKRVLDRYTKKRTRA